MNLASNLDFLKALAANNNKPWMDENKKWYEQEKQKTIEFTQFLLDKMAAFDERFSNINPKDCLFRINRDVRFSKDKSPYKTNFGIHLNAEGKKSPKAGFYVHISDGDAFVGGGIWMPEAQVLKNIRQEIDYNFEAFQSILKDKKFVKTFGDLGAYEKLARPPKGYEADNPAIEYLKLKSFTVGKNYSNEELSSNAFAKQCLDNFDTMRPLLDFLNKNFD